jgi:hypothetical protein
VFKSLINIYIDYKMLKFIGDLDKKNKQLTNLALLPGFNFEDSSNYSKKHNKYNDSIFNLDSTTDKNVISDKTFNKFYRVIDSSEKKQTKRRRVRDKKLTRKN